MKSLMRCALTLMLGLLAQTVIAGTLQVTQDPKLARYQCPSADLLRQFLNFDDLLIGELHGTVETPAFFKCLVDFSVTHANERVIVSLEMPSAARESSDEFWRKGEFEDGRSSVAMYHLVMYLVELEAQLLIDLHFQHRSRHFNSQIELSKFRENRTVVVGSEIEALSQKGKVIGLAGNLHTPKIRPSFMIPEQDFEGRHVGPSFTHILIDSALGGEVWLCPGMGECGLQQLMVQKTARRGSLIADSERGHDYIYYLDIDGFTGSAPQQ
ncbi:hypothetical protein [Arenicella xantha]|uniref:Haem-binding uptake Tiki superfamily ChaN domain-containing protein n=1 Tax=Arenicella xantha TaxID=644221 RepID=A0A395JN10_9GAMM|nr:hypothetical protein [Arenicella xantha]RBP52683.1 hypothetical protein DFR28_10165 [Arenicella xantha]